MKKYASESAPSGCFASYLRRGTFLAALALFVTGSFARAQLAATQTYAVPHVVDGSSFSAYFDFSSQLSYSSGPISHLTLSVDFGKFADLSDDPPFYSEMGLVLEKLDSTFSVINRVTLIDVGSFNDGEFSSSFNGTITFDDAAPTPVNVDPDQPASGVFRPIAPLSLLNGTYSPYWDLRVVDASFQNPLLFHSATLGLTLLGAASAVPEPASWAWAAPALLLLIALRFRSRFPA